MIDIEKQVEEYKNKLAQEHYDYYLLDFAKMCFQDGAKWMQEHAIQWHDLRKNPNDLPARNKANCFMSIDVSVQNNEKCYFDYLHQQWKYSRDTQVVPFTVIAWCELSQFKDKE